MPSLLEVTNGHHCDMSTSACLTLEREQTNAWTGGVIHSVADLRDVPLEAQKKFFEELNTESYDNVATTVGFERWHRLILAHFTPEIPYVINHLSILPNTMRSKKALPVPQWWSNGQKITWNMVSSVRFL